MTSRALLPCYPVILWFCDLDLYRGCYGLRHSVLFGAVVSVAQQSLSLMLKSSSTQNLIDARLDWTSQTGPLLSVWLGCSAKWIDTSTKTFESALCDSYCSQDWVLVSHLFNLSSFSTISPFIFLHNALHSDSLCLTVLKLYCNKNNI